MCLLCCEVGALCVCMLCCEVGHCVCVYCFLLGTVARHHSDRYSRHQIGLKLNLLCYFLSSQQVGQSVQGVYLDVDVIWNGCQVTCLL